MKERRTEKFVVALSPAERAALGHLAERSGVSGADVVRNLLRRACEEVGAPVAIHHAGAGLSPSRA